MTIGELIGRGNTAEVYDLTNKDQKVLKLFYENIPYEHIKKEYEISKIITRLGIAAPNGVELLRIEQKWGIIYEKNSR